MRGKDGRIVKRPDWVEVGRIARAHGLRGEVRVVVVSDNPERFACGSILHARPGRVPAGVEPERTPLEIMRVRGDAGFLIVAFAGVEGRLQAEGLRGAVLEVPGASLPGLPADEYYLFELKGLEVRVETGSPVGVVARVVEYPSQEVLEIELAEGPNALVPFTHEAVPEVDLARGFITVRSDFLGER